MAPVLPGARVDEEVAGQGRQADGIVEFSEREQAGVRGDGGAMEFELQAAVERDPQPASFRFTRRIIHPPPSPGSPNPCDT